MILKPKVTMARRKLGVTGGGGARRHVGGVALHGQRGRDRQDRGRGALVQRRWVVEVLRQPAESSVTPHLRCLSDRDRPRARPHGFRHRGTGTLSGGFAAEETCMGWTTDSSEKSGQVGNSIMTNASWTESF